ncbi:MAG TPA: RNA 2'-phosphotransferase [Clostridiales bacterium]|nr:RNA 2'-phosphotransferase [Clostridiales bacterium]
MDYLKLSKEVSYALRHAPWEYELELDENGWVSVNQLIDSLRNTDEWKNVTLGDLEKMIEFSEKKRHEIVNDNIRAFYGHSTATKIQKEIKIPPDLLYHGTSHNNIKSIMEYGLLPGSRQYVHLSQDLETAYQVGKRRDSKPVILKIDAKAAFESGIRFYYGNEKVWLVDALPPQMLEVC